MSGLRKAGRKVTQVQWSDLQPWVDQLVEEHGVHLDFTVCLPWSAAKIKCAVRMEARRSKGKQQWEVVQSEWKVFDPSVVGGAEAAALQMVSMLLLTLDNDAARAERQATLL